jgi:hypothetical protein
MEKLWADNIGEEVYLADEAQAEIDKLESNNEFMSNIIEKEKDTFAKQQAEIDELVDMLEELRKLQEHDDMFSPEELTRIDALIKKHKGE